MRGRRTLVCAIAWAASFAAFAVVGPLDWWSGARFTALLTGVAGLVGLLVPLLLVRVPGISLRSARAFVVGSGAAATFSVGTGLFNGQTFEAYTTPRYAGILLGGHDPYSTVLRTHFTVCSGPTASGLVQCVTHPSSTYYLYLPVLMFLQVPGLPYILITLLAWSGCLALLWEHRVAVTMFGSPFVALLAANGYNDFPAFLLLTLAFVGWRGRRSKISEYLSLGAKQFANVVVLAYYVWKRDLRNAAITVVVSVAFLVPFLLWNPVAVLCTVGFHRNPDCSAGPSGDLLNHLNYWAWPIWVVAVFHEPLLRRFETFRTRRGRSMTSENAERQRFGVSGPSSGGETRAEG